ncbi:hypothetical protein [Microvirga pakistanensis]|uniref:hypothetical protein n=1 Tax=Microvirga pakistanensis TaxID=1682650 RepID=UPI00106CB2E5|nr:hypothetical protein [Microvirga pakistanensis]
MSLTLQQIDEMLASAPGFRVVGPIQIDESGVDPIGLRQLNLDLMDATVPGINNVTVHVRPYAFMAWAWWKAGIVATENGEIQPQKMRDLVMRYEAMYAWAHSLAEHPLRGVGVIRRYLPLKGSEEAFIFTGEKWETLKGRMTSLMAPTEYGPSIKALRWLAPSDGGTFRRSLEVESAVMAIEKIVAEHVPQSLLALKAPAATWEDVFPFAEYLHITKPTREERDAFRFLFYEAGAKPQAPREIQRRMATIDLLRGIFSKEGYPIDLPTVRRRLATGWLPADWQDHKSDIQTSSVLLSILQARQLQRLAIESMMMWVERSLATEVAKAQPTEDLAAAADAAAKKADPLVLATLRVGEYMDAVEKLGAEVGWPSAASDPETDVVGLMTRIYAAQRKDIFVLPGLCLRAFAVVRAVTKGVREMEIPEIVGKSLDARLDRFPMGAMSKRIDAVADKSLMYLWRDVIEHWIIAQHVHWSAVRGVDGKKRLRIGLEGDGWIRVRPKPSSGFNATPDRLFTLLSLGTECGLFTSTEDKGTTCFGVTT